MKFLTQKKQLKTMQTIVGCAAQGAEDLYLSNPGDYPLEFADEYEIEVIEVDK